MKKAQKIIALLLAVLIVLPTLLCTFSACGPTTPPSGDNGDGGNDGDGGNGGGNNNEGNNDGNTPATKSEYKLTLKSKGGMPLSDVNVYLYVDNGGVWEYEDFLTTDKNGVAKVSLDSSKRYAYQPDVVKGYSAEEYYPVVSANQVIELESGVINESIAGKRLTLGSVMYDFEVTTTDGESFKVSEMLKTHDAVVLNFWFDGCSWCEVEFPYMNTVIGEDKYKDSIALVALSWQDSLSDIGNYKLDYGLDNITMAHENPHVASGAGEISGAFGVTGYPTTVVIDRYGVVCLIEGGALTNERAFRIMFDHFIGNDYEQKLVTSLDEITPIEEPDVEMPSSDEISDVFDDGSLGDITYENDEEDVYSWPFIIDEKDGAACIRPSNAEVVASYSQLFFDVELEAGEAIAFDYFASTEEGADILYVIVDGKDIFAISGQSTDWKTCFAYVADAKGTYSVALVYVKDSDTDFGDDTVYLRNLRKTSTVTSATYIFRYAVKNPNKYGIYQDIATVVLNEQDGYYHVGTVDGPILLANLMGYSRYSDETTFYDIVLGKSYQNEAVTYCVYASNSQLTGVCPVTEELMALLKRAAGDDGRGEAKWIEFCHYYDAYGTDKQLLDPIKGLASFSAEDAILSDADATDFPNVLNYDRLITPRGLFKKFTPTESGVYRIISNSGAPVVGWVFKKDGLDNVIGEEARPIWYQYEVCSREVIAIDDHDNAYMMLYLEAGVEYYISIAFYVTTETGTVQFRLQRVGEAGSGYQLTLMSPGPFTYKETADGSVGKILSGGREVAYDADSGYWMEKRTDGRPASYVYADFEFCTGILKNGKNDISVIDVINLGGFDFTKSEDDVIILATYNSAPVTALLEELRKTDPDATRADACKQYFINDFGADYDDEARAYMTVVDETLRGIYHGRVPDAKDLEIIAIIRQHNGSCSAADEYLKTLWGSDYDSKAKEYKLSEIYKGLYHGDGADYTAEMQGYIAKMIKAGDTLPDGTVILEGDARIGTVLLDARLAELLQLLMDKYTFPGVENSWRKLCYYDHTFCAETPF